MGHRSWSKDHRSGCLTGDEKLNFGPGFGPGKLVST